MTIFRLGRPPHFPDPTLAEPSGLLAVGGDLSPERLLNAYARGIFPWYEEEPILWFSPDPRLVLPIDHLVIARRLRRTLRQNRFELTLDRDFRSVIHACAAVEREGQEGTWITPAMVDAYVVLHEHGFAHSAEAWWDGELVGGIYGIALGSAFFGESMFHQRTDASKAALVALVAQLRLWDFDFLDCQVPTDHMLRMGAETWPRPRFLERLAAALERPTRRGAWELAEGSVDALLGQGPDGR